MSKQIPMYFDSVVVSSPFKEISDTNPNIGRLQVRVFTKYGNRNGSYITDAVAEQLIASATNGLTPVVGFFDPATQSWASHSGSALANGYGYVEKFIGWEPFEDTDGVTRDYAVFSVVLFTNYFDEAKKIAGQNQSMELNPATITGDWTTINNEEYFVYTNAEMLGFCVIGEHEPCFSVSAFFSKNDNDYQTQYDKFASILSDLKTKIEETEKSNKGGEQAMDNENFTSVEEETVVEETQVPEGQAPEEFQDASSETETSVEPEATTETFEQAAEQPVVESDEAPASTEPSEFDVLQQSYAALQSEYDALQSKYTDLDNENSQLSAQNSEFQKDLDALRATVAQLQDAVHDYEAKMTEVENNRKADLVKKYEIAMSAEEIKEIKDKIQDFSYEALESKLAIAFANKQLSVHEPAPQPRVLQPEAPESQFALLMSKYRK